MGCTGALSSCAAAVQISAAKNTPRAKIIVPDHTTSYCTQTVTALPAMDCAIRYNGTWPETAGGTRALICQRPGYCAIGPLKITSAGVSPKNTCTAAWFERSSGPYPVAKSCTIDPGAAGLRLALPEESWLRTAPGCAGSAPAATKIPGPAAVKVGCPQSPPAPLARTGIAPVPRVT